jgi:Rieske Fe-S protein
MPRCEVCGNIYDKTLSIDAWGRRHTFDCFECAIQLLAPTCDHCGCRIIGHGLEDAKGRIYCCAHCSRAVIAAQQFPA